MDRHYDYCECGKPKKKKSKHCQHCAVPYRRTPESNQRMSQILRGRQPRGVGWKHSLITRQKMISLWTPEKREAARLRGLMFASDPEWRKKIGESVSGEKSGTWEHGRSQIAYSPGWGRRHRKGIGSCEMCGGWKPLDTHHKDGSKSNHAEDNLQGLCRKCHKKAHSSLKKKRMNRPSLQT